MLLSLGESLLIFGLIVPGTVVMFGIGALVGNGVMPLWSTIGWAILGAILGDFASYWIGWHFRDQIQQWWPFSRFPDILRRGQAFFQRHGGKSILFGRFVGPVRPVIPAVAGMMGMPMRPFLITNALSALGWGPLYLLPGIVFGTAVGLAGEVATRLAVLFVVLVVAILVTFFITRRAVLFLQPRTATLLVYLLRWSNLHPRVGAMASAVIDPHAPEMKGLVLWAVILVASVWVAVALINNFQIDNPLIRADAAVLQWFREMRSPWPDTLMVGLFELGDMPVILLTIISVSLWLVWHRHWNGAVHWVAAAVFGSIALLVFKFGLSVPRPDAEFIAVGMSRLPSWHALMGVTTFGFLGVMVAAEIPIQKRWIVYAVIALLLVPINLAGLYLGAYWLSDTLAGLALGLGWVALSGIAYRRHTTHPITAGGVGMIAGLAIFVAMSWSWVSRHEQILERYQVHHRTAMVEYVNWQEHAWVRQPVYRTDMRGRYRQPLDVQWVGGLADVQAWLLSQGWERPVGLSVTSSLYWLIPSPDLKDLPLLPNAHNGRHESLVMVYRLNAREQLVLRLWPADTLFPGRAADTLWIGNVSRQHARNTMTMLTLPVTIADFDRALDQFLPFVSGWDLRTARRGTKQLNGRAGVKWDGRVILLTPKPGLRYALPPL